MAYHLGGSSGWSLTEGTARARTEVAPTASSLRRAVPASTADQGNVKPETISMVVLAGQVYPIGKFMEELSGTKRRALLPAVNLRLGLKLPATADVDTASGHF